MTHGTVTGGGISLHELYAQTQAVSQGHVSQPLADRTGTFMASQQGEGIAAVKKLDFVSQETADKVVADIKAYFENTLLAMAEEMYRGRVSLPLSTRNGKCLTDRNGENLLSSLNINQTCKDYADLTVAGMRTEIMRDIMFGEISLPLHMQNGEEITGRNNIMLAAIKAV